MAGGNNNATVAIPGRDDWGVYWQWSSLDNVQLDIVGFLAILGEGAVLANAQVSSLSKLFLLPRLLPAPQALIRPERPKNLLERTAWVTGVFSGNRKDYIHHIANVLLNVDMKPYEVRCVSVWNSTKSRNNPQKKVKKVTTSNCKDPANGTTQQYRELHLNVSAQSGSSRSPSPGPPSETDSPEQPEDGRAEKNDPQAEAPVKTNLSGPQTWVTILGCVEAIILLVASVLFGDWMSILATIMLAGLSTVVGFSNKWKLTLMKPWKDGNPPKGDVVIRYPNGSYLVVRCDEEVARELFFAPEEITYDVPDRWYMFLSWLGTMMLMFGIIFLANTKLPLQIGWAGGYVLINIAHWIAAALPERWSWDLSRYAIEEESIADGPFNENFTQALWKAILLTKNTDWVDLNGAAPRTKVWEEWTLEMGTRAKLYGKPDTDQDLIKPIKHLGKATRGIVWQAPGLTLAGDPELDPNAEWNKIKRQQSLEREGV